MLIVTKLAERTAAHAIEPLILNRWSQRAMSGEPITKADLMPLIEAARWAPSSYNSQPWRFIYAIHGAPQWNHFTSLLDEFNRSWAPKAGALLVLVSKKEFEWGGAARTHSFDAGAAWQNFALQGSVSGLVVHGMEGFDYARARELLHVPDDYAVEMMIAVGKPGDVSQLTGELVTMEKPSDRRATSEIAFEGRFPHEVAAKV
jgi:nitroreductase